MRRAAWLPSPLYAHLLQAALHTDDQRASTAYRAWTAAFDLPHTDVDRDIVAVLPVLAQRLSRIAPDDPLLPRLRGFVRYSWTRNQLTMRATAGALRVLLDAKITPLLFKGAALMHTAYDSAAFRPMDDIDVLIAPSDRAAAFAALQAAGWTPIWVPREGQIEFIHGVNFRSEGGQDIDLHWYALLDGTIPNLDADLWRHARAVTYNDLAVQAVSSTDSLILTLGNAARADGMSARWAVDAALVIARCPDLDWDRFCAAAAARRLTVYALPMLGWLRDQLGSCVPDRVMQTLAGARVAWWERLECQYRAVGERRRGMVYDLFRYLRLHALGHPDARTPLHYGRKFHNLPRRRAVPLHILRVHWWRWRYVYQQRRKKA